jgi:hypothetical protein
MTGCLESGLSLARRELDRTIETLAPLVEALLERLSPNAGVTSETTDFGFRAEAPLRFPDGIGRGTVAVELFRYHDAVRLDLMVEHNRRFVRPDGSPSDRRCYLNDFQASLTIPRGAAELPESFVRSVISGVHAAREGVARHNRLHPQPWHQITIGAV